MVNNGETAVIAGLTTNNESESEIGIPYLMDIPVLGWLFKYKSSSIDKQDLIRSMRNLVRNFPEYGESPYFFNSYITQLIG